MGLVDKINDDMKTYMKAQDKEKLNVIRMVKGAMQLAKVELKRDLEDNDVIDIISKQIKMRKDSIEEFAKANRDDLIKQYSSEIDILSQYMPSQLSLDEVMKIIDEVFNTIKPTTPKQMGLVMKEITPKVKGRFDVGEVSKIVKEKLSNI